MSGLILPIYAIFFATLLCVVFYFKKKNNLIEDKVYAIMLLLGLLTSILLTIIQCFPFNGITSIENTWIIILSKINFLMLIAYSTCLFFYTALISYSKERVKKTFNIVFTPDVIAMTSITFLEVKVISNTNTFSISGAASTVTYILCQIFMLLSITNILLNIKNNNKRYIPICAIVGVLLFLIIIFYLNSSSIVIALTFINYVVYFTFVNSGIKEKVQAEKEISSFPSKNIINTTCIKEVEKEKVNITEEITDKKINKSLKEKNTTLENKFLLILSKEDENNQNINNLVDTNNEKKSDNTRQFIKTSEEEKLIIPQPEIPREFYQIESEESFHEREQQELVKEKEKFLTRKGVNITESLNLLGNMEMYEAALKKFADEANEKWLRIMNYKEKSDLENYTSEVQSLKNDSQCLGFMHLADIAYQHERRSKDNDMGFITHQFQVLEKEFNGTLEIIDEYMLLGKDKFMVIEKYNN